MHKPLIVVILSLFALVVGLRAGAVIHAPGEYPSADGKTVLTIASADGDKLRIRFFTTGPLGGRAETECVFDAASRWACLVKNDDTLWLYRGEDTVFSFAPRMNDASGKIETTSINGRFDLRVPDERKFVPQALLDFIEKAK